MKKMNQSKILTEKNSTGLDKSFFLQKINYVKETVAKIFAQVSNFLLIDRGTCRFSFFDSFDETECCGDDEQSSLSSKSFCCYRLAMLVRTFMFLGFSVLPPNHALVPPGSDAGNLYMLYAVEQLSHDGTHLSNLTQQVSSSLFFQTLVKAHTNY